MKNIQSVSDSYLCSNCGACSAICSKDAIEFKWSSVGRLYASVNEKCVDCGLCKKVCPSIDTHSLHTVFSDKYIGNISNVYIGKSLHDAFYKNAQSGGIVTTILSYLFQTSQIDAAIVCTIDHGEIPLGVPVVVTSEKELYRTQKSCYTPVPILSKLRECKDYESIAIVGIPCHIQGVISLLRTSKHYSNIKFKIGLICDRTECAGIQYLIKDYTGFEDFSIEWRKKYSEDTGVFNYQSAPIVATSADGRKVEIPRYYRTAQKELFTPPRCRVCWDKLNVFADITVGDPWRLKGVDMKHGESLVITRNMVGDTIINQMGNINMIEVRDVNKHAPRTSQLITDRRRKVEEYSSAFSCIPVSIDSYLLHQHHANVLYPDRKSDLLSFIELEMLSESEIVNKAKSVVAQYKNELKNNSRWYIRLLNKIKTIRKRKTTMRFFLTGVETNNKGAELMLYAILQQIEKKHPDAEVYMEEKMIKQGAGYVQSPIKIKVIRLSKICSFCHKYKITGLLNRIGLFSNYLNNTHPVKDVDYYIDGSGLSFSDKHISSPSISIFWERRLRYYKEHGSKIVFLPQGFGPLDKQYSKDTVRALTKYADLIFAREKVSLDFIKSVVGDCQNVHLFTDFTALVDGICPEYLHRLAGRVCLIPNIQMVNKGALSKKEYFEILDEIIKCCRDTNHDVYILNHEGARDNQIATEYINTHNKNVEFVTGLNALEVKGLIATSYLVISSRFHGVASSLNGQVPCLATSWHHKYSELFNDFGVPDSLLSLDDREKLRTKILKYLDRQENEKVRALLKAAKPTIVEQNKRMWELIWTI